MQPIEVKVTRDGMRWEAEMPGVTGMQTWARTLPGLDQAVRDAIAVANDLSDEEADRLPLRYDYRLGATGGYRLGAVGF